MGRRQVGEAGVCEGCAAELRGRQVDVWTYCGALAGGRSSRSAMARGKAAWKP